MSAELTEQEKRELKTEGLKEAAEYFQSFEAIKKGIDRLDEVWYELKTGAMDPKNAKYTLNSLHKTRNKARTIASCLEQEYGCLSLNRNLPVDYKLEDFDNSLKVFDFYHSVLSRKVKNLEARTAAIAVQGV